MNAEDILLAAVEMETPGERTAFLFFLAMTHGKPKQKDEAVSWLGRAVRWMEKHQRKMPSCAASGRKLPTFQESKAGRNLFGLPLNLCPKLSGR